MSFHGSLPVWAEEPSRPSVDGQADRAVHLLADEPGGPGVGLDLGAGEDLVGGENLLLGGSPGLLGLLQLPDENQEQQVSLGVSWEGNKRLGGILVHCISCCFLFCFPC